MFTIISIQRSGERGVVQYAESGIIKAMRFSPSLSDDEVIAMLDQHQKPQEAQKSSTAKQRKRGKTISKGVK